MDEIDLAVALWNLVGVWALPVLAVMWGVRVFRLPAVQAAAPSWLRWDSWPMWGRWIFVALGSLAASVATSLAAGLGWVPALVAALPVAAGAVWGHKGTKVAGHLLQAIQQARDPLYQPSKFRKVASIVVPLNHRALVGLEERGK